MQLAKPDTLVALMFVVTLVACTSTTAQRPGDIDPAKREWYGEFYDLEKYAKCRSQVLPNDMACEYLRLTRVEEPEYWPYPGVPKPKLPEAPNPPVYQPGMTSEQYFKALCEKEAGEFIYKTVENVEGIYQIRPRKQASSNALRDRNVMEDPYGYTDQEARNPQFMFVRTYGYFETKKSRMLSYLEHEEYHPSWSRYSSTENEFERFSGFEKTTYKATQKEIVTSLRSRYGYLWHGIKRPNDRELAIAGGELIVVDLRTGEILGIRRGFAHTGFARGSQGGINWETAEVCPRLRLDGWDKGIDFSQWFVSKVLKSATAYDKK